MKKIVEIDSEMNPKQAMENFINLNRQFKTLPRDQNITNDQLDYFDYTFSTLLWSDILQKRRVVILAEAGTGKSAEFKYISNKLNIEKKFSFFLRIEDISRNFESAFEIGSLKQFATWISSNEDAWFFLDSVDESRLENPSLFELSIKIFAIKLSTELSRAHIYISGRVSEWRMDSDYKYVKEKLPFEIGQSSEYKSHLDDLNYRDFLPNNGQIFEILTLLPLDRERINYFITKSNIKNGATLYKAIEEKKLYIFASRILDLSLLILFWEKHSRVGDFKELMAFYLEYSLLNERDPTRDSMLPLSLDLSRNGAQIVAASLTLTNNSRIQVPDSKVQSSGINLKILLFDWDETQRRALLNRPIFDDATYGTVRIHHRLFREYLTAQWFLEILKNGMFFEEVENVFIKEKYGVLVIDKKLKPVLSWIAIENNSILEKVLQIEPELLISESDSSKLPLELKTEILERVCEKLSKVECSRLTFDIGSLQMFSQPELGLEILELYEKHKSNVDIKNLLLRLIWSGSNANCLPLVKKIAIDITQDEYTRVLSIRSILIIDRKANLDEIINYFANCEEEKNSAVISSLIGEFGPENIKVSELLLLIKKFPKPSNKEFLDLSHSIRTFVSNSNLTEIPNITECLAKLIKLESDQNRFNRSDSTEYYWVLGLSKLSCLKLLKAKDMKLITEPIIEFLSSIANFRPSTFYYMHIENLQEAVMNWPDLNLRLFLFDIEKARELRIDLKQPQLNHWTQVFTGRQLWKFSVDDFDLLSSELSVQNNLGNKLIIFSLITYLSPLNEKPEESVLQLRSIANGNSDLEVALDNILNPKVDEDLDNCGQENFRINREIEQERIDRENEELKIKENVLKEIDELKSTDYNSNRKFWNIVLYFDRKLRNYRANSFREDADYLKILKLEFGESVVRLYINAAIRYWRKGNVHLNFEKYTEYNIETKFGLRGIEYEIQRESDFPNYLNEEEAILAFRFALKNIGQLPEWSSEIYKRFSNAVQPLLLKELEWALSKNREDISEILYSIERFCRQEESIMNQISIPLFDLFEKNSNYSFQIEKEFMRIFLSSPLISNLEIYNYAENKFTQIQDLYSEEGAYWLSIMMATKSSISYIILEERLNALNTLDGSQAINYAMRFLENLIGNSGVGNFELRRDFRNSDKLLKLYLLLREFIKPEEDIDRRNEGVYTSTLRDDAQRSRERLIEHLSEIPGKETFLALRALAEKEVNKDLRAYFYRSSVNRAELDADFHDWSLKEIRDFGNFENLFPKNHIELFERIVSILESMKRDIENGDYSDAELLLPVREERIFRRYFSERLKEKSDQLYLTTQEEELPDSKRTDIRIHGMKIEGPIPIELKIANLWTGPQLFERLKNQLCGDYLRDQKSTCGIYLLLNTNPESNYSNKQWQVPKRDGYVNFMNLELELQNYINNYIQDKVGIEKIKVIGIDLTNRKK